MHFQALVLERLRFPIQLTEARCECSNQNNIVIKHRAACPHSGKLKRRAVPTAATDLGQDRLRPAFFPT